MTPDAATQREWLRPWNDPGPALAAHRREELLQLSDEPALVVSGALLSLVTTASLSPRRLNSSGLVEQQALFRRRPCP